MKMDGDARVLEDFVRFTRDRGTIEAITSRMVFDWLDARKPQSTHAAAHRLSPVRQFLLYLSAAFRTRRCRSFECSQDTGVRRRFCLRQRRSSVLLKCAAEFEPGRFSSVVLHTVLGLLAATGLRVSEALGLDRPDVMPRSSPDTLLIREAKFHKSRIVPLHPTTAEQLRVYAGHRELMGYGLQTSAFFVSSHGGRLAYEYLAAALPHSSLTRLASGRERNATSRRFIRFDIFRRIAAAPLARRGCGRRTPTGAPGDVSRTRGFSRDLLVHDGHARTADRCDNRLPGSSACRR